MRSIIFMIYLLIASVTSGQSLENWSEITFQSQARIGELKEIRITPDSVHYRGGNLRNGGLTENRKCLATKAKKQLQKVIKNLNGTDISNLTSPSNKRAFDGASHSQISIKTEKDQSDHYFDDESPHEKLAPLLKIMLGLSKN